MKKELVNGITIEIMYNLVLIKYDKRANFSYDFLCRVRELVKIAFPSYELKFIEREQEQ